MALNLRLQRGELTRRTGRIAGKVCRELGQPILFGPGQGRQRLNCNRVGIGGEPGHESTYAGRRAARRHPDALRRLRPDLRDFYSQLVFDRLAELGHPSKQFERERRIGHVISLIDVDVGGAGIENTDGRQRGIGGLPKLPRTGAVLAADRILNRGARGARARLIDVGYDFVDAAWNTGAASFFRMRAYPDLADPLSP